MRLRARLVTCGTKTWSEPRSSRGSYPVQTTLARSWTLLPVPPTISLYLSVVGGRLPRRCPRRDRSQVSPDPRVEGAMQCVLLRDIFGNPFIPPSRPTSATSPLRLSLLHKTPMTTATCLPVRSILPTRYARRRSGESGLRGCPGLEPSARAGAACPGCPGHRCNPGSIVRRRGIGRLHGPVRGSIGEVRRHAGVRPHHGGLSRRVADIKQVRSGEHEPF